MIFEYTYQHAPTSFHWFFPASIIYAANAILNDKLDPEQRAYLFYYIGVGRNLRSIGSASTVNGTMQALLAIAYDKGAITNAEAMTFTEQFKGDSFAKDIEGRPAVNNWVVDMDAGAEDAATASADALASRFAEISLFSEFTEGVA